MSNTRITLVLALGSAIALAGCAGGASSVDYDAMLASMMKSGAAHRPMTASRWPGRWSRQCMK